MAVGGATNINSALSSAFKIKDVDYIYFLTDGVPTRGETNIDTILDNVKGWYKDTEAPIKAIAFLEGYFEYDDKPGSRKLMSKLAEITHGDYIDSSASKKVEDDEWMISFLRKFFSNEKIKDIYIRSDWYIFKANMILFT